MSPKVVGHSRVGSLRLPHWVESRVRSRPDFGGPPRLRGGPDPSTGGLPGYGSLEKGDSITPLEVPAEPRTPSPDHTLTPREEFYLRPPHVPKI